MTLGTSWANVRWLGRRLARGAQHKIALGLVAGCAAAVTVTLLLLAAAPSVRSGQEQAADAVRVGETGAVTGLYSRLNIIEWREQFRIEQIALAGTPGTSPPPGLSRVPAPGETVVSPALAEVATGDAQLAAAIPGEVVGLIGATGLISPADLRLYVGVDAVRFEALGIEPVYGFGAQLEFVTGNPILPVLAVVTTLLFVVIPVAVVMASALGQVSVRRAGQIRSLHALGAPNRFSRLAVSIDAVVAASVGAAVGVILVLALRPIVHGAPFLGVHWWPHTVGWSPLGLAAAVLVAPVLAVVYAAASRAQRSADIAALPPISLLRFVPLIAGLVVLGATAGQRVDGSLFTAAAATVAVVLLTIGVPLAAEGLAGGVARRLVGSASVGTHLAAARVARGPVPARRVMTVIAAVVVLGAAAAPLVAQAAPTDRNAAAANARLGRFVVQLAGLPDGTDIGFLRRDGVLAVAAGEATQEGMTFAMPCSTLERFEGPGRDCADGMSIGFGELLGGARSSLGGYDPTWQVAVAPSSTTVSGTALGVGGTALVLVEDEATYWTIKAAVNEALPLSFAESNVGGLLGGTTQSYAQVQHWLRAGLVGLLASAGIAFVMGLSEDARSRRSHTAGLVAAGAPPTVLRIAHRGELAIRLGATTIVTAVAAVTIAAVAASWTGADPIPAAWITSLLVALITLTAATTALVPFSSRTDGTLDELRSD